MEFPRKERRNRKDRWLINAGEKMDKLYTKMEDMVGERFNPLDFIGKKKIDGTVFTEEEVLSDLEKLKKKKENWEPDDEKVEKFSELSEMSWVALFRIFFPDAEVRRTSQYDDARGIDFVLSLLKRKEDIYFNLGVDSSFSYKTIVRKIKNTELKVRTGKSSHMVEGEKNLYEQKYPLHIVKYFIGENGIPRTVQVPRLIIGMDYHDSEKLIKGVSEVAPDEILNSLAYPRAVLEILWQSRHYYKIADIEGNRRGAKEYARVYNEFLKIFRKRRELFKKREEILDDKAVRKFLEYFDIQERDAFRFRSIKHFHTSKIEKSPFAYRKISYGDNFEKIRNKKKRKKRKKK